MPYTKSSRTAGFANREKDQLREDNDTNANDIDINNHNKAADHFILAGKFHLEAATFHAEGNHNAAAQVTLKAIGNSLLARGYQEAGIKSQTNKLL